MLIDNFKLIEEQLVFENPGDFYIFVIIIRKKDGNENSPYLMYSKNNTALAVLNHIPIKEFYVYSKDEYINRKQEMIMLAEIYNARVYFYPQRKNNKYIFKEFFLQIAKLNKSEKFNISQYLYYNTCVNCNINDGERYIIDIDEDNLENENAIRNFIGDENICYELPTVHGKHFITTNKFDYYKFLIKFPTIAVKLNNPTLAYYKSFE